MGTAALGPVWAALLLFLLMCEIPMVELTFDRAVASGCQRCCDSEDPLDPAHVSSASSSGRPHALPEIRPYINITILKVGRKTALHSGEDFQTLLFERVFVNLDGCFDMATGQFAAPLRGIYFFSLNVHSWNYKETYVHIMHNQKEAVILYAQPSERSIMQSQSVMLDLAYGDRVWVRLFKRQRENAIYSNDFDTYITFSGHLIKAEDD
uniref:Complement C1q tumor necrosis factor-related protein 6 n=1 Tax=Homo sapiens TaxID=9606 RepID=A0A1S5UZH7_HUMAN|nr:complement C1q tumor necrosis factor-related protein 6 [Homo sapiens]